MFTKKIVQSCFKSGFYGFSKVAVKPAPGAVPAAMRKGQICQVLVLSVRSLEPSWTCNSKGRSLQSSTHSRSKASITDWSWKSHSISETRECAQLPWIQLKDLCEVSSSKTPERPSASRLVLRHSAGSWMWSVILLMNEGLSKQQRDIQSIVRHRPLMNKVQEPRSSSLVSKW